MSHRLVLFGQRGPYATSALQALHLRGFTPSLVVEGLRPEPRWRPHRWVEPRGGPARDPYSLQQLAGSLGIPVVATTDVNSGGAIKLIKRVDPDLMLCAGFDRLFSQDLLSVTEDTLNLHPSLLPRWPGPSPLFWMGRSGDRGHGVTLHRMAEEEDSGEILHQIGLPYSEGVDGWSLLAKLGGMAGEALAAWKRGEGSALQWASASEKRTQRARRPRAEDAALKPEEWSVRALAYFCHLAPVTRAPWLVLGGDTFFVEGVKEVLEGRKVPGQYMQEGLDLLVNCRDGVLKLRVQGA